jgi:tight adherence protein B
VLGHEREPIVIAIGCALLAALGAHLLYTSIAFGWTGLRFGPTRATMRLRRRHGFDQWLVQAGLAEVRRREFVAVAMTLGVIGAIVGAFLFGSVVPAVACGGFAVSFPIASARQRRENRMSAAVDAWPRLIEEIRTLSSSAGRSIPQALFESGEHAPIELRAAFDAAHREWLLSTDFRRTVSLLKSKLADPTADMVCETLLIAHEVGGSDIERRLEALAEDRRQDMQSRKDARARQAGARFARRFVLAVPVGMALAGMSVGNGRAAYRTPSGQLLVCLAITMVIACWWWAGRIMRLPRAERVFVE